MAEARMEVAIFKIIIITKTTISIIIIFIIIITFLLWNKYFCYGTSIFDPTPSKKFLYQIGLKPTFDTGCGSFVVVTSLLWLPSKSQWSLPVQHSRRCQELEQFDFWLFSLFLFWREAKLLPPCWFDDYLNITLILTRLGNGKRRGARGEGCCAMPQPFPGKLSYDGFTFSDEINNSLLPSLKAIRYPNLHV